MLNIESGIEVSKIKKNGRPAKYPFRSMGKGDSFLVEIEDATKINKKRVSIIGAARHHKGLKITTRKVDEGLRVWCVEPVSEEGNS